MARLELGPPAEPNGITAPTGRDEAVVATSSIPGVSARLPTLVSTVEIAAAFGRSPRTIRRWVERRYLVPVRIGGAVFFREEELRQLILDRMVAVILKQKSPPADPNRSDSSV